MSGIRLSSWRGEPSATLAAGQLTATFLPGLTMLGVSVSHRGDELLAPVAPLDDVRAGRTTGIPLLHPWANRLARNRYRVPGSRSDVTIPRRVPRDGNGLPIHGTTLGLPFTIDRLEHDGNRARLTASFDAGAHERVMRSFPFPHVLTITATVSPPATLEIETALRPTSRRAVPVSFGWHPYFRLPGTARSRWELRMPARRHAALDLRSIPTGAFTREAEFRAPIGRHTFDDHYRLGRDRHFTVMTPDRTLSIEFTRGYPFAQVWVPPAKSFICIEPMAATVDALGQGTAPLAAPGTTHRSTLRLDLD
jgi:aldose 1-epimerase